MFAWHGSGERNGVHLKVRFFDAEQAQAQHDRVARTLCFLPGTTARMLWREQDRHNLRWQGIVAQSDAVYALGGGLVHLEFKTRSGRAVDREHWLRDVRAKDMLQCLIAAVVVAQTQHRTCAAVLRYHDAGLLLVPQQRLLDLVIAMIPQACQYYGRYEVASSDLAAFAEPRVLKAFPWRDEERSRAGMRAHGELFR